MDATEVETPDGKPAEPPTPKPAAGNVISNLHLIITTDAYTAIEHPEGWTEEDVKAALAVRAIDFGRRVSFWDSPTRSRVKEVILDEFDPDNKYQEPFKLTEDDLVAAEDPSAVEA